MHTPNPRHDLTTPHAVPPAADPARPLAVALAAALCCATAFAQQDGAPAPDKTLREVKVTGEVPETASGPAKGYVAKRSATGTKSDLPLAETPQSITVITREQIEAQGADSLDQAFGYSAGIVPLTGGAQRRTGTAFVVRGFNVTGSAPLYLNGTKFPINSLSGTIDPFGYERIELLKGPASVLYGQAAPGGIINLVSKRPTPQPLREVEVQVGSWSRRQVTADFGGPLDTEGRLGYRLTAQARDASAMVSQIPDDRAALTGAIDWRLTNDTQLTLLGTYSRDKSLYDYGKPLDGTLLPNRNGSPSRTLFVGEPGFDFFNTKGSTLGYLLEHRFNDTWQFRQNVLVFDYEADNTFATIAGRTDQVTQRTVTRTAVARFDTDKGVSVDNQLHGKLRLGDWQHTVVAGLDYSDRDFSRSQRTGAVNPAPLDLFNPVYGVPFRLGAATLSLSNPKQLGLYAQDHMKVAERWVGLIGGRYDKAKITSRSVATTGATTVSPTVDTHSFTPRAALMYLADGGWSPYYSYSRSFQPTSGLDVRGQPFKPTEGEQHEIGFKYEPAGYNATLTASLYQLTQQNVLTGDPLNPGFSIQTGEQRSRGAEVELRASVSRQFDLLASLATTDAKVTRSNTAGAVGTRPTSIPRYTAAVWADWKLSDVFPGLSLGLGVRRNGDMELNPITAPSLTRTLSVPGFTVWDAAVHYQVDRWRFAVNVKNLTDKTYLAACSFACFYGDERNVTVSARYSW